jgi:N utilization substance protein B
VSGRGPRHAARQAALQGLYAADIAAGTRGARSAAAAPLGGDEVFETIAANFDLPESARAFAKELVCGVTSRRDELDALLTEHSRNWRISRMAAVDRNILRLAVYELLRTATPASVILDEAIELARRFGDQPSPAFVNGVLDAIAHTIERHDAGSGAGNPVGEPGSGALG